MVDDGFYTSRAVSQMFGPSTVSDSFRQNEGDSYYWTVHPMTCQFTGKVLHLAFRNSVNKDIKICDFRFFLTTSSCLPSTHERLKHHGKRRVSHTIWEPETKTWGSFSKQSMERLGANKPTFSGVSQSGTVKSGWAKWIVALQRMVPPALTLQSHF